jgi:transposase
MSFLVKRVNKNNGKTYLYRTQSVWDKELQQSRQVSEYVGIEEKSGKVISKKDKKKVRIAKSCGDVYFLKELAKKINLTKTLINVFGEDKGNKILELAIFKVIKADSFYLYQDWSLTKEIDNSLSSQYISDFLKDLEPYEFFKKWCKTNSENSAFYYDITSVSTYSTKTLLAERGYNRDKENLHQINLGMISGSKNNLPLLYNIYPGSINDVSTIENIVKLSKEYNLKDMQLILDCGFFSQTNIQYMLENKIDFIMRLSPSTTIYKQLLVDFKQITSNLIYLNDEGYYYVKTPIDYKNNNLISFTFHNETKKAFEFNKVIKKITEVEDKIKNNSKDLKSYLVNNKLNKFFNKTLTKRNNKVIEKELKLAGKFALITSSNKTKALELLTHYRDRDLSEKIFDTLKTELGYDRLRTHSNQTAQGTIFISFIANILYASILNRKNNKNLTVPEILNSLSNIQKFITNDESYFLSEITKKNRNIFKEFKISTPA